MKVPMAVGGHRRRRSDLVLRQPALFVRQSVELWQYIWTEFPPEETDSRLQACTYRLQDTSRELRREFALEYQLGQYHAYPESGDGMPALVVQGFVDAVVAVLGARARQLEAIARCADSIQEELRDGQVVCMLTLAGLLDAVHDSMRVFEAAFLEWLPRLDGVLQHSGYADQFNCRFFGRWDQRRSWADRPRVLEALQPLYAYLHDWLHPRLARRLDDDSKEALQQVQRLVSSSYAHIPRHLEHKAYLEFASEVEHVADDREARDVLRNGLEYLSVTTMILRRCDRVCQKVLTQQALRVQRACYRPPETTPLHAAVALSTSGRDTAAPPTLMDDPPGPFLLCDFCTEIIEPDVHTGGGNDDVRGL